MARVVEQGDVFFFYRPRVDADRVDGLDDVQRFFLILRPDRQRRARRIIVGRKRLPEPSLHEREWAFVADVADDPSDVRGQIGPKAYETATRGVRVEPEARPVGEGRYAIVEHDGHTHFVYVVELPRHPGPAQEMFGVHPEASYVVAVRNPKAKAPPGAGLRPSQRAAYPPELMEQFGTRRFASVTDPRLLDYEGAELVLIGAADDVESELGIELDAEDEQLDTAEIFRRLHVRPGDLVLEPLVRGEPRR
jgi:hypothetical protein